MPEWLQTSDEAGAALRGGGALVALESTVVAHGLPRPRNLAVARRLESRIREAGATPATVALIRGQPRLGLESNELEEIATSADVEKLSTRDLPLAIARGATGATTVAATARIAAAAGVAVFATGGIGGVHRGTPLDVSADLLELSRSPVIVVCAGAKSILDIAATRELLETLGVLVLGWRTDRFPAFYSRDGGAAVDARVESAREVADVWHAHRRAGAEGAILLCVPIPRAHALDEELVEGAIQVALRGAAESRIAGKAITPFLLRAVADATGGASLEANIALLENNATIAAGAAVAIADQDEG